MASNEKYTILYGRLSQEDTQKTNKTDDSNSIRIKSYYVEGGFSHLIHMTAAHLW